MDEFEVLASLYTPVSELALGEVTNADAEATFGRAGNDALRTYSPVAINSQDQNVDYLFGDILDNSAEEREVFRGLQEGTDPLGILDIGPPSVGADRFILGDVNIPYYDDELSGTTSNDPFNNFFGLNDFSVIYDFNPEQDTIQLHGSPEDYLLVEIDGLPVAGVERPFFGEAIFQLKENQLDLVSYVVSTPEVDFDLNDDNFEYVDGANPPSLPQAGQIGSPGVDVSYGSATDSEGNLYLTGITSGAIGDSSQGGFDSWVAKYNSQGQELWRQQIGSSGGDRAYGIEIDNEDNVYLTGQTDGNLFDERNSPGSDAWLAKLSGADGEIIWGRQYGIDTTGGNSNGSFDLAVDEEGAVYASGLSIKESTLPPEVFDFSLEDDSYVIKFDTDGNQQWFTPIDTPFFNESYGIDVDNQGNVYATGWTQFLVEESDPGRDFLKYDYWLAGLDSSSGEIQSLQQFNSSDNGIDFAWDTETDSQGNIYVAGWTTGDLAGNNGSYDPFLVKYNPDGTQEWTRQFGTGGDDAEYVASFDIDAEDNIYVTGFTDSNFGGANQGDYDTWVVKYDSEGNQIWTQQLGTANREYGTDVAANEFGDVFVTGFTNGSLGTENAGAEDAWVAKLDADSGSIENFATDTEGEAGVIGQEPEDNVEIPEDGQLSEEAITESLNQVFAPDEEFTESLGDALNENAEELTFEDETGAELEEEEIEEIEGVEVDVQDDEGEALPDDEDSTSTGDVTEEVVDTTVEDDTDEGEVVDEEEDTGDVTEEVVDTTVEDDTDEGEVVDEEEDTEDVTEEVVDTTEENTDEEDTTPTEEVVDTTEEDDTNEAEVLDEEEDTEDVTEEVVDTVEDDTDEAEVLDEEEDTGDVTEEVVDTTEEDTDEAEVVDEEEDTEDVTEEVVDTTEEDTDEAEVVDEEEDTGDVTEEVVNTTEEDTDEAEVLDEEEDTEDVTEEVVDTTQDDTDEAEVLDEEEDTEDVTEEVVDTTEENTDEEDTTPTEEVVDTTEEDDTNEGEVVANEENSTDDEQLSQEEIIDSLNEVFAPEEGELTESLGDSLNENSDELTFEDETGAELEEEEIEEIEGIGNTPAANAVAGTPAADVVANTPANI